MSEVAGAHLIASGDRCSDKGFLNMSVESYVELLDRTDWHAGLGTRGLGTRGLGTRGHSTLLAGTRLGTRGHGTRGHSTLLVENEATYWRAVSPAGPVSPVASPVASSVALTGLQSL